MTKKSKSNIPWGQLSSSIRSPFGFGREALRLGGAWSKTLAVSLPAASWKKWREKASMTSQQAWADILGESCLSFLDEAGPFYGKIMQIILSRLDGPGHSWAQQWQLTRVYSDWPALNFEQIKAILDEDIPNWQDEMTIEEQALGVASMGQVHGARGKNGQEWVVKILKPRAVKRLEETLSTLRSAIDGFSLMALPRKQKRVLRELDIFVKSLQLECSLLNEKKAIDKMRSLCKKKSLSRVVIPKVWEKMCTERVLVVERFRGLTFQDLVEGKGNLSASQRQELARDVMRELLSQVFDLGFFHADPHAGNLILLEDGRVGLFDWGLSGELSRSDRDHIASMLRAVMSRDLMELARALQRMAVDAGMKRAPSAHVIWAELQKMLEQFKKEHAGKGLAKSLSIEQLVGACMQSADRLQIPLPVGLLLMMKSLVTIEGLAKGIDPDISMARVAGPVLWRAARPGIKDILRMLNPIR